MLNKEECEIALENAVDAGVITKDWKILNQLIEEHFVQKENTEEYKHFKLHSDSTLKNQTKKELIDYIKMLYHNWGVTDEQLKRVIDKAKELSDSNDELRGQLYFCEPYKFEDLKPNMWVYDGIEKLICQIGLISKNAIHREYVDGTISDSPFEENRFFPVQYANLES
ncbi:hypothetical protein [Thomasclavelia ramosa]|jgi:predicted nuclease with TOPRIM domain|uniref:hypothetical protein n=1 Tax=Thomasclavelia ramosa TaxID=1547 RepID=UPI000E52AE66|nr:hypothetical protein [Thomasclavelia ramosa]RGQ37267.1 hypothetical protein DWY98_08320 [Thomasclavelia ramosa]RGQ51190.1 hypothetical protein DWY94_08585 [Thomasclavelia ramosa]